MENWYELNIKDRYNNIYKKYSLEEFLNWWNDGEEEYMEIRFDDWTFAKEASNRFGIPYNKRSVFIKHHWQINQLLKCLRKKSTMWFGINPKRYMRNRYGSLSLGGSD